MPLGVINNLKQGFLKPTDADKKRFIEVTSENDLTMLEEWDFTGHELHMVVSQGKGGEWSCQNRKPFKWRIGEMFDFKNMKGKYHEGFIRAIENPSYKVHIINSTE